MKRLQIELDLFVTLIITLGLTQLLPTSSTLLLSAARTTAISYRDWCARGEAK